MYYCICQCSFSQRSTTSVINVVFDQLIIIVVLFEQTAHDKLDCRILTEQLKL